MIYLDNSATTKPFPDVVKSYSTVATEFFGNPSSLHSIGGQAEKLLTQARMQIADLLGVKSNEIYFTSGGTEGNNFALKGAANAYQGRGKHIITTEIEHDSIHKVMEQLQEDGFTITYLPVDENGLVSVEDIKSNIRKDTSIVSIMHVNNEIGSIQPIAEIGSVIKKQKPSVLFHVDGVQGIGKLPVELKKANIDLYTISAHKFHGLKGNGVLYIREGLVLAPLLAGGGQERNYRSGTENVAGAVSTAKALRMQLDNQLHKKDKLVELNRYLRENLAKMEDVVIHSPLDKSIPHIINFSILGIKAEVFVHALEKHNIYLSTTSACSSKSNTVSKTLTSMEVAKDVAESSFRISLHYDNTLEEIKITIEKIADTIKWLRGVMK
ncbi:cysteine desulfurase family protein [Niallia sp. NCCP-28]|uniref:cysteine desulfurase family protein n=1 Tax=Niallia sp. NCCP-28 TaxID=2934712 RepID=UPI0020827C6B|nr:cysteine desulfurase family protein [Niallia sp. NCCP-28]GKU81579.1 aminotransferase V [Niallia sp. NCCP-28]